MAIPSKLSPKALAEIREALSEYTSGSGGLPGGGTASAEGLLAQLMSGAGKGKGKGGLLAKLLGGIGGKAVTGGLAALLLLPLVRELLDTFTPFGPEGRERKAQSRLQRNQLLANALLLQGEKNEGEKNRAEGRRERALLASERRDESAGQRDLAQLFATKGGLQSAAELSTMIQRVAGMAGQLPPMPGPEAGPSVMQQMGL